MRQKIIPLFLCALFITSCVNLSTKPPEVEKYILNYKIDLPQRDKLPAYLNIDYLTISSIYNTSKFIFKTEDFSIEEDFYNRWIVKPDKLLYDCIKKDFMKCNFLSIDNNGIEENQQQYKLKGHIHEIYGQFQKNHLYAVLAISFNLYKYNREDNNYKLIFNKIYRHKTETYNTNMKEYVAAMSENMKIISEMLINDVYINIKNSL